MIENTKKNISLIVILFIALVCIQTSLVGFVDQKKYVSPKVPKFKLPVEIISSSDQTPGQFPPVKVSVLLGDEEPVVIQKSLPKKTRKKPYIRPLKVNAIMIEGKERIANINGQMMKVGGYLHGRTILKIEKNGVLVTGPNGKRKLKIKD